MSPPTNNWNLYMVSYQHRKRTDIRMINLIPIHISFIPFFVTIIDNHMLYLEHN